MNVILLICGAAIAALSVAILIYEAREWVREDRADEEFWSRYDD
jgi:hypothetical protein